MAHTEGDGPGAPTDGGRSSTDLAGGDGAGEPVTGAPVPNLESRAGENGGGPSGVGGGGGDGLPGLLRTETLDRDEPDPPARPSFADVHRTEQVRRLRTVVDLIVVGTCVVFTLWHLQPDLLLSDTTPAGGDMGAHVWGPAYLRDHLLPNGQVAGWSGAWYAGFPAYQFYMVVPSLLIVLLNAGFHGWAAVLPVAVAVASGAALVVGRRDRRTRRLALAGLIAGLALVGLPYGVAFKLVSVSGVVTLPVAAYAFGRLAGTRFPTPAVLAVSTLPFLFYRGFTIYGGNIPSTLAGEFAFSMSLSLGLVYLGVVLRGLETGRYRVLAAVLLALTGLCHLIPAFWVLGATAVAVAVRFRRSPTFWVAGACLAVGGAAVAGAALDGRGSALGLLALVAGVAALAAGVWRLAEDVPRLRPVPVVAGTVVVLSALAFVVPGSLASGALLVVGLALLAVGLWLASESVRWLTPTLAVGGLLSMWWVGPFYLRSDYLNDMGWEKLPYPDENLSRLEEWTRHLLPHTSADVDLRWVFALALVGAALSIALQIRTGLLLLLVAVGAGIAFIEVPEGRLWNGRLLPFYYLSVMLLAGLGVSETVRTVAEVVRNGRDEPLRAGLPVAFASLVAVVVIVGVPLGQLPFSEHVENGYAWPRFSPWQVQGQPASFVTSWARWNYSGYEGKDSYREYYEVVRTMDQVGEQRGCGRALWEYEKELDRYGTPMALMLLPHWTDGCIGSMEGLYFEASATTPFHFLMQVELSSKPSAAQRDMPYGQFDITKGVEHLQMMGVRYYMATSEHAISQARTNPDLTEVAASGPWVVFEVADSEMVSPLDNEPAVVDGITDSHVDWVEQPLDESGRFAGPAVSWFVDRQQWDVPLTSSGPDTWQRVEVGQAPGAVPLEPVEVTNVEVDEQGMSFDVDRVGVPVLVKMSYFPNWRASGADGPYRAAPNLMIVVPQDTHVELTYGRTSVEYLSYALTFLGIAGLLLLARRPLMRFSEARPRRRAGGPDPGDGGPEPEATP